MVLESYIFGKSKKSSKRTWLKNLLRSFIVVFSIVLAYSFAESLDKFMSVIVSITATPVAFIFPPLFHYKLIAESTISKVIDLGIVVFGIAVIIFNSAFTILTW